MSTWKRDFANGLVVLGPILVTLYVGYLLYGFVEGYTPTFAFLDASLAGIVPNDAIRSRVTGLVRVGIALGGLFAALLTVGTLMRTAVGNVTERLVDGAANHVPGIRMVYNASKTAAETAFAEEQSLQQPVKVDTWAGLRMTAFETGKAAPDGRTVLFLPTSPNVSSGFVLEVDSDRVTELDETVEEALSRVLSAGFGGADRDDSSTVAGGSGPVGDERE